MASVKLAAVTGTEREGSASVRLVLGERGSVECITEHVRPPVGREVLVRVHAVGLCGTDAALYDGSYAGPRAARLCFGHEWSGVVEALGEEVTTLTVGDKVVGECLQACGACRNCRRDPNLCSNVRKFGITVDGAARRRLVLDERYLHRADAEVDLDVLALAEPVAVAAQSIARAKAVHDVPLQHSRVAILGGGMIGLACAAVLRFTEGCRRVVLVDPVPERLEFARTLGAEPYPVPPQDADRSDTRAAPQPGFDLVINAAPSAAALAAGLDLLRPLGTLVCLGFVESFEFCPRALTLKAGRVIGSVGGTGGFELAIDLVSRHQDRFRKLITHTFPYHEAEAAFVRMRGRRTALKVLLRMTG